MEVPSTEEGEVSKILVKVGDKVSKGDKLIEIQSASEKKQEPEKKEVKNSDIPKDTEKIIVDAEKSPISGTRISFFIYIFKDQYFNIFISFFRHPKMG